MAEPDETKRETRPDATAVAPEADTVLLESALMQTLVTRQIFGESGGELDFTMARARLAWLRRRHPQRLAELEATWAPQIRAAIDAIDPRVPAIVPLLLRVPESMPWPDPSASSGSNTKSLWTGICKIAIVAVSVSPLVSGIKHEIQADANDDRDHIGRGLLGSVAVTLGLIALEAASGEVLAAICGAS